VARTAAPQCVLGEDPIIAARVPYLPIQTAYALYEATDIDAALKDLWLRRVEFRCAVLLASPSLFAAVNKWIDGVPFKNKHAVSKLLMYAIRMSTRPTPFGTFAAIGAVYSGANTTLQISERSFRTITRPDMGWLGELIKSIEALPSHRDRLKVYSNDLVVERGSRIYVFNPTKMVRDSDRLPNYARISMRMTSGVELVRDLAKLPIPVSDLTREIARAFQCDNERARTFIDQLIEAGLLLPAIRPVPIDDGSIVAENLILLDTDLSRQFQEVRQACAEIDATPLTIRSENLYQAAFEKCKSLWEHDSAFVQVDMALDFIGDLGEEVLRDVERLADYTLREGLSGNPMQPYLDRFTTIYEGSERLVPLLDLVDSDFGLGRISMEEKVREKTGRETALAALVSDALLLGQRSVHLSEQDVETLLPARRESLEPRDCEIGFEIFANSLEAIGRGDYFITLGALHGSGAVGRTLGRFGHLFEKTYVDKIRQKLAQPPKDEVYAELVFTPEHPRNFNVLIRPRFVDHEIQIGCKAPAEGIVRLDLSDLFVGIEGGRFVLWSQKLGKRVHVRESHVFNSTSQGPALIRFLSLLAAQTSNAPAPFSWGPLNTLTYLPRICVDRLVLSPARWRVPLDELALADDPSMWLREWQSKWKIPEYVILAQHDNRLLIKLSHSLAPHILLQYKNTSNRHLDLIEALSYEKGVWMSGDAGTYSAEFVASVNVRGSVADVRSRPRTPAIEMTKRVQSPLSPWVSLRIPCGINEQDRLLVEFGKLASQVRSEALADKWFFVRYNDGVDHLRLRFEASAGRRSCLQERILALAEQAVRDRIAPNYSLPSYIRELERYGGSNAIEVIEEMFSINSFEIINNMKPTFDDEEERFYLSMLTADPLLTAVADSSFADLRSVLSPSDGRLNRSGWELVRSLRSSIADNRKTQVENPYIKQIDALIKLEQNKGLHSAPDLIMNSVLHMHFNRWGIGATEKRARDVLWSYYNGISAERAASRDRNVVVA